MGLVHQHKKFLPDGRVTFAWTERSRMVIDGRRLTSVDCEDPGCPYLEGEMDPEDFLVAESLGSCWHCGEDCSTIEVNFETYLHKGKCTEAKWKEYLEALTTTPGG